MRHLALLLAVALLATPAFAQTTGIPGVNDLSINGQNGGTTSCANTLLPTGPTMIAMNVSSLGNEIVIGAFSSSCVPGAVTTPDPLYTLDLNPAGFAIAFDGSGIFLPPTPLTPFFNTPATGNWDLAVTATVPTGPFLAIQIGLLGPGHALGFALTQAHDLSGGALCPAGGTPVAGIGDDTMHNFAFASAAPFIFYGESYSSVWLNSNGNLSFCAGSTDFTASEAEFLGTTTTGLPRIGLAWADFSPNAGGTVTVDDQTIANGTWSATWCGVPMFACTGDANDFGVTLDQGTGFITMQWGLMGLCNGTATQNFIVGISANVAGAAGCPINPTTPAAIGSKDMSIPQVSTANYEAMYELFVGAAPWDLNGNTKTWIPSGGFVSYDTF